MQSPLIGSHSKLVIENFPSFKFNHDNNDYLSSLVMKSPKFISNVICLHTDNSAGKSVRVPYRDSVLTKLLMNALGGNSKTIMVSLA